MNICIVDPIENVTEAVARALAFKDPFIRMPLMDDLTINAESDLSSFKEMFPSIGQVADVLGSASRILGGQSIASRTELNIQSKLNMPTWNASSTKPIEVQLKLGFFSEVQSEKPLNSLAGLASFGASLVGSSLTNGNYQPGHWVHTLNKLISYSILSIDATGNIIVPGTGIADMPQVKAELDANTSTSPIPVSIPATPRLKSVSKLVHVTVPGIIDIAIAIIPRVTITYSKHITDLGYPLWAQADVTFQGILPAFSNDFTRGATLGKQLVATSFI